jgi:hypothetical protein
MGKLGIDSKSLWPVSRESVRMSMSCIMYLSTAVVTECTDIRVCRLPTG